MLIHISEFNKQCMEKLRINVLSMTSPTTRKKLANFLVKPTLIQGVIAKKFSRSNPLKVVGWEDNLNSLVYRLDILHS